MELTHGDYNTTSPTLTAEENDKKIRKMEIIKFNIEWRGEFDKMLSEIQ